MLPKGIPHWFQVGETSLHSLVVTTGQFERYVAACGGPAHTTELPPPGPPDLERAVAAGERFRIDILGPPPVTQPS